MLNRTPLPKRAPALILLAGAITGLLAARTSEAPVALTLFAALTLAASSLIASHRRPMLWWVTFTTATSLAFWAYGSLRLPEMPGQSQIERPIREATLHIKVLQVMQAQSAYGKATGLARIIEAETMGDVAQGDRVYFSLNLEEGDDLEVMRGIELRAIGLVEPIPEPTEAGSFDSYLRDTGTYYRFDRAHMLEYLSPPSPFEQFCHNMNLHFQETLRLGAPEEGMLDSIYIAMLLGEKAELSDAQKDRFRMTGTMHFFAISGLHIGVIATVIAQFLILIRVPRKWGPFIGLPLLYLYVEITGASPSAVRAFLMALFFWLSFAFARQRSALSALATSAVFVLIVDPTQLWSLGFQLSYTVVLSILLFGLPFYEATSERLSPFRYLPKANWSPWQHGYAWSQDALLLLFTISFAAWLASAPLSAAFFSYLSPGAIVLNMALVNLAALSISAGVISLTCGLFAADAVAGFVNHASWTTIHSMDRLVNWSTELPGMMLPCENFPHWIAYLTLASYFGVIIWNQNRRTQNTVLSLCMPPFVVLIGLLIGLFHVTP